MRTQNQANADVTPDQPARRPITTDSDALLNTVEAAWLLGLSPRTLEAFRVRGDGPPFIALTSRAVRYRRRDLDAWVLERRRISTADTGGNSR